MSLNIRAFPQSLLGIDSWGHVSTRLRRNQKKLLWAGHMKASLSVVGWELSLDCCPPAQPQRAHEEWLWQDHP